MIITTTVTDGSEENNDNDNDNDYNASSGCASASTDGPSLQIMDAAYRSITNPMDGYDARYGLSLIHI